MAFQSVLFVSFVPYFGGIKEAAVKSLKRHLQRILGEATLTFEEMSTLLAQIEACLNSRPLQALSNDLAALISGHFLIGSALITGGLDGRVSSLLIKMATTAENAGSFLGALV